MDKPKLFWMSWYQASDEAEAWSFVRDAKAWPDAGEKRFCEFRDSTRLSDRFPPSGWMRDRMEAWEKQDKLTV